jgi:glycosyltransferase involved in cell wall biosynthesis
MRCLLLSRYGRSGASSRVRFYQYLPYLHSCGIEVEVAPLLGDEYVQNLYQGRSPDWPAIVKAYLARLRVLLRQRRFDVIWLEAEVLPWVPFWLENLLARPNIPYVVDYDDAAFHRYDLHPRWPIRWTLGRKIDEVMRGAALVIAGNDYLKERAYHAGAKRIEVLPTAVDLDRYRVREREGNGPFTIGWIGSPVTAVYLGLLRDALRQIGKSADVRVRICGSGPIQMDGVALEVLDWNETSEVKTIQGFDVGVMPIPDSPWTRGKCGYKLIQYMACGLPVVASAVGVNRQIVEEKINGLLADTTEQWVQALQVLKADAERSREMGMAGRLKVEARFSLQATAPRLGDLLKDTTNGSVKSAA